jgi:hypothetical protein
MGNTYNVFKRRYCAIVAILVVLFFYVVPSQQILGHFEHFTHYNNNGDEVGKYFVYQQIIPEYAKPGEPAQILFSIQHPNGDDTLSLKAMVEIYSSNGKLLKIFPWNVYKSGDFGTNYTFEEKGTYQVVLSVAKNNDVNEGVSNSQRGILTDSSGCLCDRAVFNVAVSKNFGNVYTSTLSLAIIFPLVVLGAVLIAKFRAIKKDTMEKRTLPKYVVMLLALAGGIIHLTVYSEHSSLRLEYGIFLIAAGGAQIAYGSLYIFTTFEYMSNLRYKSKVALSNYYNKTVMINLFGLAGTVVLVALYSYTIFFPPPLSPNNQPETIELAGILAKSVELLLIVGIIYLMRWEKQLKNMEMQRIQK